MYDAAQMETTHWVTTNPAVGSIARGLEVGWDAPISGDRLADALPPFTPSAGNLWTQPGVNAQVAAERRSIERYGRTF